MVGFIRSNRRSTVLLWVWFILFGLASLWVTFHLVQNDVSKYQHYANRALTPPWFHYWPPEYPVLSQGVFLLPRLLPWSYRLSFALVTLVALLGLLQIGLKRHGVKWGLKLMGYLSAGAIGLFSQRYDIVPSLCAFWALDQAQQQHWKRAWMGSVLGFGLKLWPAMLWPVFLIQEWRETQRWHWDRLAYSLLAVGVLMGLPVLTDPRQSFTAWEYLLSRPIEVESVAASISVLLGHFHLFYSYGSVNVQAHGWVRLISLMLTGFGGVSVIWVWWQQSRGRIDLADSAILTLLLVLLASKIFSPQYLIWLAPWLALKKGNVFFILGFMTTTAEFPIAWMYWPTRVLVLVIARNAWMLFGTGFFAAHAGLFSLRRKSPTNSNRKLFPTFSIKD